MFSIVERFKKYVFRDIGHINPYNSVIGTLCFKNKYCLKTKPKRSVFAVSNKLPQQYLEKDWGYKVETFWAYYVLVIRGIGVISPTLVDFDRFKVDLAIYCNLYSF